MLKVALLAATVALAASAATATTAAVDSATTPTIPAEAPCRPGPAPELGCPLHPAEPGTAPADLAGLAGLATPEVAPVDVSPLHPARDLAFKDAATEASSVLPASVDRDRSQRLAPALLALGALIVLLRRRPN